MRRKAAYILDCSSLLFLTFIFLTHTLFLFILVDEYQYQYQYQCLVLRYFNDGLSHSQPFPRLFLSLRPCHFPILLLLLSPLHPSLLSVLQSFPKTYCSSTVISYGHSLSLSRHLSFLISLCVTVSLSFTWTFFPLLSCRFSRSQHLFLPFPSYVAIFLFTSHFWNPEQHTILFFTPFYENSYRRSVKTYLRTKHCRWPSFIGLYWSSSEGTYFIYSLFSTWFLPLTLPYTHVSRIFNFFGYFSVPLSSTSVSLIMISPFS